MPKTIEEGDKTVNTPNIRPNPFVNQRRSQRILLSVPLCISGKRANGQPFTEYANTLIVNAHGALVPMKEPVREGQSLKVKNVTTGEEIDCTVMDVNPGANDVPEIGLEFGEANPRFWRVSFPPADWSPRTSEAKRFAAGTKPAGSPVNVPAPKK